MAADHEGGVLLLTDQDVLERYSAVGRRQPAKPLSGGIARHDPGHTWGWIGTLRTGTVLVRQPGSLAFSRLERGAESSMTVIGTLSLDEEHLEQPSTVFATAVLSDGRLVSEVIHRAPAIGPDGLAEVRIARRLQVLKDGMLSQSAVLPIRGGVGQLIGAGPDDEWWFVTTRQMLTAGERPRLSRVVLR